MSEQDKRLMSPDEVRERREASFAREVATLVESWRKHIANAMLAGECNCVTPTVVSNGNRRMLDAALGQLEAELHAAGWKRLCWEGESSIHSAGFAYAIDAARPFGQYVYVRLTWSAEDDDAQR